MPQAMPQAMPQGMVDSYLAQNQWNSQMRGQQYPVQTIPSYPDPQQFQQYMASMSPSPNQYGVSQGIPNPRLIEQNASPQINVSPELQKYAEAVVDHFQFNSAQEAVATLHEALLQMEKRYERSLAYLEVYVNSFNQHYQFLKDLEPYVEKFAAMETLLKSPARLKAYYADLASYINEVNGVQAPAPAAPGPSFQQQIVPPQMAQQMQQANTPFAYPTLPMPGAGGNNLDLSRVPLSQRWRYV
jgi:hypothetical protein